MSRQPKPVREIPFAEIERDFELAGLGTSPSVGLRRVPDGDGYYIRVFAGATVLANGTVTTRYDYFHLTDDGTVLSAPRGYAKDYRPGRITGLDEALAKYTSGSVD